MQPPAPSGSRRDDQHGWWDRLVTDTSRILLLTVATAGLQFALTTPMPATTVFALVVVAVSTLVGGFVRVLDYTVRAHLLAASLLVFGAICTRDFGPRPAIVLAMEIAAMLTALVHGGWAGIGVQALASLCLFVGGRTASSQMIVRLSSDLGRDGAWVRISLAYFLAGTVLIAVVAAAFRHLRVSLARTRDAEQEARQSDEQLRLALEAASVGTFSMDVASGNVAWSENVDRVLGTTPETVPLSRQETLALVHADDRERVGAALDDVTAGRLPEYRVDNRFVTAQGRVIWTETRARICEDERTGQRRLTGTIVDVTARRRRERARHEAQATLLELARSESVRAGDRAAALRELTEAGTRLMEAERCGVWLLEDDGRALRLLDLFEATPTTHTQDAVLQVGDSPDYFAALAEERAIAADDARVDPRTRELAAGYMVPLGITALLDAPIFLEGRMAGVICHEHVGAEARGWTAEEQNLAGSLADCVGRALEAVARVEANAHLERTYRELGVLSRRMEAAKEDERRRIARELHDELGQTVTAMKINLELAARSGSGEPAAAAAGTDAGAGAGAGGGGGDRKWIADVVSLADHTIHVVRELSRTLRPPLLDELGLVAALRAFAEEQQRLSGVRFSLEGPETVGALPPEIEIASFRVVQEGVTNALRHAQARTVDITLGREAQRIRVRVRDDGRGFDVAAAFARALDGSNLGLIGMRERVRTLGGTFSISSRAGDGAEIRVELPLQEAP